LDVGAGSVNRYKNFFQYKYYKRLDIQRGDNIDIVGSAEDIPAENASFDSIICTQVLGDIYDFNKVISEFNRVLTVGGTVMLSESFFDFLHNEPHDYWRFTKHALQKMFTDKNFEILTMDRIGGFYATKAQMNIRYLIFKWRLYNSRFARLFSVFFKFYGSVAIMFDAWDKNSANKSFCLGWLIITRKIK